MTFISFIIWVTQQSTNFLQVSPRKIENFNKWGAMISARGWKIFRKKIGGGRDAYSGPESRMAAC